MANLKVAQINCTASGGSTGKIVEQLSRGMTADGIDNIIISSGYKERKKKSNVRFISSAAGVRLHQLLGFLFGDSGFHSFFRTLKAIRILKKFLPDIVHIHNLHGYYLHVGLLLGFLKRSGIPVVWTVHDCWMFTGHCTHYTQAGCRRWREGCGNCPQRKQYPYSLFLDRSRKLWAAKKKLSEGWRNLTIVTVSGWLKGEVEQSFWNRYPIRRIYNGVDIRRFVPENSAAARSLLGISPDTFVILGVAATWNVRKGLDDFTQLAGMLVPDEKIVLVGVTGRQKENLPENVTAVVPVREQWLLACYYNAADVYVSFSREETMGMTVVEAMACGTPVLAYDSTSLPELIGDGCGYVVKVGDVSAALNRIRAVKSRTRAYYSAECRRYAAERFDREKQYREYAELYRKISRKGDG